MLTRHSNKLVSLVGYALAVAGTVAIGVTAHADAIDAVDLILYQPITLQTAIHSRFSPPILADNGIFHAVQSDDFGNDDKDKVNVTRAVGLSLLLPGAGHWAMGSRGRAGLFFGAEAIAWSAFGYFKVVQSQKADDFELYARTHAGVDPADKDDEFYRTLSFYMSRQQFNDEGRLIDPDRPYYPDDPEWDWQWESKEAMARYRNIRNQSNEAASRAKLSLGAALLNRLVAAADAWRTARSINREARMENASWKVRLKGKPSMTNPGLMVVFSKKLR